MGRKKKDKKEGFNESTSSSCMSKSISLPPNIAFSGFYSLEKSSQQETLNKKEIKNTQKQKTAERPHYQGHRKRLRERFIANNGNDMPDYEILELLLFRSQPRKDTKPLAKALLKRFGSLAAVLSNDIVSLQNVEGCGETIAADLKLIGIVAQRMLHSELPKRDIFTSWEKVISYCRSAMAYEKREQFRVLFLDKKNGLIIDKILQTGTVDHTSVYPREVIKEALDSAASSIILVHNHPSGDPTPSRQDISMTSKLQILAQAMSITIQDHLIIGRNGYASLRELDLL